MEEDADEVLKKQIIVENFQAEQKHQLEKQYSTNEPSTRVCQKALG